MKSKIGIVIANTHLLLKPECYDILLAHILVSSWFSNESLIKRCIIRLSCAILLSYLYLKQVYIHMSQRLSSSCASISTIKLPVWTFKKITTISSRNCAISSNLHLIVALGSLLSRKVQIKRILCTIADKRCYIRLSSNLLV
jgi:hypothetical protein